MPLVNRLLELICLVRWFCLLESVLRSQVTHHHVVLQCRPGAAQPAQLCVSRLPANVSRVLGRQSHHDLYCSRAGTLVQPETDCPRLPLAIVPQSASNTLQLLSRLPFRLIHG